MDIFTATLFVFLHVKLYANIPSECEIISYATEKVFNSFQDIPFNVTFILIILLPRNSSVSS